MEMFVKMTDEEYETFKKAVQINKQAETDISSFLKLKGYQCKGTLFKHPVDKPYEKYDIWEKGSDRVLVLIRDFCYEE